MAASAALALAAAPSADAQAVAPPMTGITLLGHVPTLETTSALEGPVMGAQTLHLSIALPVQDPKGLDATLHALYDPTSPSYHQFLTPAQFTDRFSPTQAQYDAVSAYLTSKGLAVTGTHTGRLLLEVQAVAQTIQSAFGVHLNRYLSPSGREFFAPDVNPTVDPSMAGLVSGVIGLDDVAVGKTNSETPSATGSPSSTVGTGPNNFLAPADIKEAYNLTSVQANGAGQSVALFEADGFNVNDIYTYETRFQLPAVPLTVKLLDGTNGNAGVNTNEVCLDIELVAALAPNLSHIYVYELPNDTSYFASTYMQIADDDLANQVSTSWSIGSEGPGYGAYSLVASENTAFEKMAAQGQSMFVASGDTGPYPTYGTSSYGVQDPASQPWVCSVGGTSLTATLNTNTSSPTEQYVSEATWNGGTPNQQNGIGDSGGG